MTTHPVTIENDAIRADVWPMLGGKVSSIIDKADKFELLFSYPAEIPTGPSYDAPYHRSWYAGWDECFPAVAAGPYAGYPYNGVNVPDHGELWGLPTVAVPTKDGITTVWNGLRFGYRMTRKLALEDSSLVARYTLVNLAPFPFQFVWAMHALMAMPPQVRLELAAGAAMRFSHDSNGQVFDQNFAWPALSAEENFASPDQLPPKRAWKVFSVEPIMSPMIVHYPSRSRRLEISYSSEEGVNAYWGIWINSAGRHMGIEPTSGRFDQLDRAEKDGSAGKIDGSAQVNWTVTWRLR